MCPCLRLFAGGGDTRTAKPIVLVNNAQEDCVMENSRIEGIGHQVKGGVKESLGKAIGDAKLVAEGAAERTIGEVQSATRTSTDQVFGIDTDRINGIGHQLKGALMQRLGSLIGNPKMQASGIAERLAGEAQNAVGSARDVVREAADKRPAEDTHASMDAGGKAVHSNDGSTPQPLPSRDLE